jgi:hypothetical protein
LATVHETGEYNLVSSRFQICVIENDSRCLAAKFKDSLHQYRRREMYLLEMPSADFGNFSANPV